MASRRLRSLAILLAFGLATSCDEAEPPTVNVVPPPVFDDCARADPPALLVLPSRGEPLVGFDEVAVSERGCVVMASGRAGTLRWFNAWSEPAPEEFRGRGTGLSADGYVTVGHERSRSGGSSAFWFSEGRGRTLLGRLSAEEGAMARAVSADGQVAVGDSGAEAFRWRAETGQVALPALAPGREASARDCSADGAVIVGRARNSLGNLEAVLWSGEQVIALGDLPGGTHASEATAVSPDGAVAAGVSDAGGRTAFRWTDETGMEPLPCPEGQAASACDFRPHGIAEAGALVVGCATLDGSQTAVAWTAATGTVPVAELLARRGRDDLQGWQLDCATDVSANGRLIAGAGRDASDAPGAWLALLP